MNSNTNDDVVVNDWLVAKRAIRLFESEYIGQEARPLWAWAVAKVKEENDAWDQRRQGDKDVYGNG